MNRIEAVVTELAGPVVESLGMELWDVEYVREAGEWYLRLYIDRAEGGIFIDDCEAVSKAMDPILDEADPIAESYTFEVSSAGAERHLKRPSDFQRFMGSYVEVKLYKAVDGRKSYIGNLIGYDENNIITVSSADGEHSFEKTQVASVRLRIE